MTTAPSLEPVLRPFEYAASQNGAGHPSPSVYSYSDSHSDTIVSSHFTHSRNPSRSSSTASPPKAQIPPWTLSQAFAAVSGSITVPSSTFWACDNLTFTPPGIVELARAGLLPSITPSTHKRDRIATLVVSVQSLWFIAQAIARLCNHLPLTLLEIHTLASLFITIFLSLVWLPKSFMPSTPPPHDSDRLTDLAALFAIDPHLSHNLNPDKNRLVYPVDITECTEAYTKATSQSPRAGGKLTEDDHAKIAELHVRASRALEHLRRRYRAEVISSPVGQSPPPPNLTYKSPHVVGDRCEWRVDGAAALAPSSLVELALPFLVAVLYGALVMGVSWAASLFTNGLERELWRGAGGVFLMIAVASSVVRVWYAWRETQARWVAGVVHGLCWFMSVLYVVAKLYVLGEVFAGLRSVPQETWKGVDGVDFVPHVGG
ncbi:hypothetical protein MPH_07093 [Macrophomina phaseolina MS6]|uniref:Uncharacterized protein n=1 Tax=Macrophomina phaseolina (strain MS6) TaxID=1126212 RepID=K2RLT6_MACPH|nr:hypothetical protein MPH_07093 [Macrophomina phaseolina MS6]